MQAGTPALRRTLPSRFSKWNAKPFDAAFALPSKTSRISMSERSLSPISRNLPLHYIDFAKRSMALRSYSTLTESRFFAFRWSIADADASLSVATFIRSASSPQRLPQLDLSLPTSATTQPGYASLLRELFVTNLICPTFTRRSHVSARRIANIMGIAKVING